MPTLEIAATSLEEAQKAVEGGAASLEICSDLAAGGVTPPFDWVKTIREAVSVPLNVMIRIRAGDFVYRPDEMDVMAAQIEAFKPIGVNSIVFGALTADGDVDMDAMRIVVEAAAPLAVTLHRALDVSRNPDAALEKLRGVVARILTSGPAPTAWGGRETFRRWVETYGADYRFACSGGITMEQLPELVRFIRADEYHIGGAARTNGVVDVAKVRQLKAVLVHSAAE